MTMTLEQTLRAAGSFIAWRAHGDCRAYQDGPIPESGEILSAIDAHLTQPAQSADVAKVREVIENIRDDQRLGIATADEVDIADKLTAALQEKGK